MAIAPLNQGDVKVEACLPIDLLTYLGGVTGWWRAGNYSQCVTWTSVVGCVGTDNILTRGVAPAAWDAGAISTQVLSMGLVYCNPGWVEFTVELGTDVLACGLSASNVDEDYDKIRFCIMLAGDGHAYVYEVGVLKFDMGVFNAADVFRVEVGAAGAVTYYQNGALEYTSADKATAALFVDCSIFGQADDLLDAVVGGEFWSWVTDREIKQWLDASGNGYHLSQATYANRPKANLNAAGHWPGVLFDGTNDTLATAAAVTLDEIFDNAGIGAAFIVARTAGVVAGAKHTLLFSTAGIDSSVVSGTHASALASLPTFVGNGLGAGYGIAKKNVSEDQIAAFSMYFFTRCGIGANDTGVLLDILNNSEYDLAAGGAVPTLTNPIYIGSAAGADYFGGEILEIITVQAGTSEAGRCAVHYYLAEKYGVDFASTHYHNWVEMEDVIAEAGIEAEYGLGGSSMTDRVAETGTMSFTLDNSEINSAGLVGRYSPNHVNCAIGWRLGTEVRLAITYEAITYYKWRGRVSSIVPEPGIYAGKRVAVDCVDWMEVAARTKLKGLQLQTAKRSDELFTLLMANLAASSPSNTPAATVTGHGIETFAYAFDNLKDEEVSVLAEFQRLANSELGYIFVKGDIAQGETLVFEDRRTRGTGTLNLFDLTDANIFALEAGRDSDDIVNRVQVQIHPRRVDAASVVLFTMERGIDGVLEPLVVRNSSLVLDCPYRDPVTAGSHSPTRVSGTTMVTPAITTDYTLWTGINGTGTNISTQLTVVVGESSGGTVAVPVWGGNSAEVTITNNGPFDGYLHFLQLRGLGIYDYEAIVLTSDDEESKKRYSEAAETLDMPYQSDPTVGLDAATYLLMRGKSPLTQVSGVEFTANYDADLMRAALALEISSRIGLSETVTGINSITEPLGFFINAIRLQISHGVVVRCTWALSPADLEDYWVLDTAGKSELDTTTRIAFGLFNIGWVLADIVLGRLDTTTRLS